MDGEWHSLEQIASTLQRPVNRLLEAARGLAQFELLTLDEEEGSIRIQPWLRELPVGEEAKP